jgi:hypothetical protein
VCFVYLLFCYHMHFIVQYSECGDMCTYNVVALRIWVVIFVVGTFIGMKLDRSDCGGVVIS